MKVLKTIPVISHDETIQDWIDILDSADEGPDDVFRSQFSAANFGRQTGHRRQENRIRDGRQNCTLKKKG